MDVGGQESFGAGTKMGTEVVVQSGSGAMMRAASGSGAMMRASGSAAAAAQAGIAWYAVYTSANHERRVAEQLGVRGIEHFLPTYESVRKWKDRRVTLQMPLFPGYVFVQIALEKRLRVLQVPGVARLVGFNGEAATVPEEDIIKVREFLRRGFQAEPHPFLRAGRRVRVRSGPLEGMEGIVVRRKNGSRFVISFELIQRAMAVDVEGVDLAPLELGAIGDV